MFLTEAKLRSRLHELSELRYRDRLTVPAFRTFEDPRQDVNPDVPSPGLYSGTLKVGDTWSGRDLYLWLHADMEIPAGWAGRRILGRFDLGATGGGNNSGFESLFYLHGKPYQGVDSNHLEVFFNEETAGTTLPLTLRLWSGLEGGGMQRNQTHGVRIAEVCWLDEPADDYYYTLLAVSETVEVLDENLPERAQLLKAADRSLLHIDWNAPGSDEFYDSLREARDFLSNAIDKMDKHSAVEITAVGHTHIDVAWLWRLKHTREKAARSFSTVMRLMELFPEYTFLQTQPQLYDYVKNDYPELYEDIKARAAEGRWETGGAMWLEADCNLTSGESLVRQILVGTRFYREEFGAECDYLWLPDVFGYSWALPQILKKSGIRTFMTTKISWNQYNRMPHDTFMWRGMDGTEILTHFITTTEPWSRPGSWFYTYNGNIMPKTVKGSWDAYRDKELNQKLLFSYGYGDGGGGVNRNMLEMRRRIDRMPGLPKMTAGSAGDYFRELRETVENSDSYVHTWDGELYLEYHRGTYTSQAYNKRMNRKLELLYRETEWLSALDAVTAGDWSRYAKTDLDEGWKIVLRNQFHDIIPGSSIREVYEDSTIEYAQAQRLGLEARLAAERGLLTGGNDSAGKGVGGDAIVRSVDSEGRSEAGAAAAVPGEDSGTPRPQAGGPERGFESAESTPDGGPGESTDGTPGAEPGESTGSTPDGGPGESTDGTPGAEPVENTGSTPDGGPGESTDSGLRRFTVWNSAPWTESGIVEIPAAEIAGGNRSGAEAAGRGSGADSAEPTAGTRGSGADSAEPTAGTRGSGASGVEPAAGEAAAESGSGVWRSHRGERLNAQRTSGGAWLVEAKDVPSLGYAELTFEPDEGSEGGIAAGGTGAAAAKSAESGGRSGADGDIPPASAERRGAAGAEMPAAQRPADTGLSGAAVAKAAESAAGGDALAAGGADAFTLREHGVSTPFYELDWNERGQLTRLYDRAAEREVLAAGQRGNVLQLFEDKPLAHEAWDVDIFYQQKSWELDNLTEVSVIERGPLRCVVRFVWETKASRIQQHLTVYARDRRIDFKTTADWHERRVLLKAAFPVHVRATEATYDVQYGNVTRPTHWNTSWDMARFETVGHQWADLSDKGYGVSLLNDCKYGYDIKDNVMRLSLIKCAQHPDTEADQGSHEFTYSLLPHDGDWLAGGTVRSAWALNSPLRASAGAPQQPALSMFHLSGGTEVVRAAQPARTAAEHGGRAQAAAANGTGGGSAAAGPNGTAAAAASDAAAAYRAAGGPTAGAGVHAADAGTAMISAVKRSEDGRSVVLRVHDFSGSRQRLTLGSDLEIASWQECDLLERPEGERRHEPQIPFVLEPYQIRTFAIELRA
ncbi:glycoside hydrolase family 38 C-terminal domain-containing protein [Saccharibacillus sp. CPCC 101409]|uniref:glycoside hydrolase family 38 N-terminal domain-containing protein n=1 Tax=Saccharibacillus sp. CPCC 101409 TaxID=3058041 RepID=UPI002672FA2D|nr:glycoside hydrolase family 38 C-terminal domain-containing protein [Saccharibacillus sp. CPCC 101409]MDO3412731.1 glycoside hydrolase family 38 C-terminal domain-containing protein [Saccharibacillus sp. CPCC 101409]